MPRKKPTPASIRTLSVSLPGDLIERLDAACEAHPYKVTRSSCVEVAIAKWIEEQQAK